MIFLGSFKFNYIEHFTLQLYDEIFLCAFAILFIIFHIIYGFYFLAKLLKHSQLKKENESEKQLFVLNTIFPQK